MATSITSISGLQNLSNLTMFQAIDNNLQTINLSNLTNLNNVTIIENSLNSVNITNCTALTTVDLYGNNLSEITDIMGLDAVTGLQGLNVGGNPISGSVDVTAFLALTALQLEGAAVTEVIISDEQPINFCDCDGCKLTETSVNNLLVALSTNEIVDGTVRLTGVYNSPPTGPGIAAKSVLETNGWTVDTN